MVKESLGITPNSNSADSKNSKFTDLSYYQYDRNSHDKSMFVNVSEIDFMIAIDSFLFNSKDKEKFIRIVRSSYSSLFNCGLVKELEVLTKSILDEHFKGYYRLEYCVLSHIVQYHLKEFKKDLRSGNIDKLIELCVSKGNLIVKVYPKYSTDDNPVSYTISLLYLVILHLHKQVNKDDDFYSDYDLLERVEQLFLSIIPIVTKVSYTISIVADDNYSMFSQLQQLESGYKFLMTSKDNDQVMFTFRPKEHFLTSTLYTPVINETPSDTNYQERCIECSFKLQKNNVLTCTTHIVSKDMVDSVFTTQIDSYDEPACIYSALSDDERIYYAHYSILNRMLSFTVQHENLRARARLRAAEDIEQNRLVLASGLTNAENTLAITKNNTVKYAFKDVVTVASNEDKLLDIVLEELKKLKLHNGLIPYAIIIMELLNEDKSVIDETLSDLDDRISDRIKSVIKKVKKKQPAPELTLNSFYRNYGL